MRFEECRGQYLPLDHLGQHYVATLPGPLRIADGVITGNALEHAHQRGTFQLVQVNRILPEKGPRSGFDSVGVVGKLHRVEIHLDNLILGVAPLELHGRDPLLHFAPDGLLAADAAVVQISG